MAKKKKVEVKVEKKLASVSDLGRRDSRCTINDPSGVACPNCKAELRVDNVTSHSSNNGVVRNYWCAACDYIGFH